MAQNTNNLPYFRTKKEGKEKRLANFLLRKFWIKIKVKFVAVIVNSVEAGSAVVTQYEPYRSIKLANYGTK